MPHLLLTTALLFALLAIVATAVGSCLGIARHVLLEESGNAPEIEHSTRSSEVGLDDDFGVGLRNAANIARDSGRSFRGNGSFNARV